MKKLKSVSLCMIVKNEEKYLAKCLDSVKELVDEMIIVDTGSIDATLDIAKEYGAKIFSFQWDKILAMPVIFVLVRQVVSGFFY